MKEEKTKRNTGDFLFIIAVAFIVHMIPVLFSGDFVDLYDQQAIPILKGENIYQATHKIFPYSPVTMFIPALFAIVSIFFKVPFPVIMKIPAVLGDVFTAGALFLVMSRIDPKRAYMWGLFYAVNPVSLLITSFHGNLISIPTLFIFLSYAVLLYGVEENYRLSALLLGLAIGFRGFPILLVPLFLIKLELPLEKKLEYVAYALVPTALSFVPFLLLDYRSVFREVFSYSGFTDHGFVAILRAAYSLKAGFLAYGLPGNLHLTLSELTKPLFLAAYVAMLLAAGTKRLIDLIIALFLAFYFIIAGISSQYLIWVLPFAFLARDRFLKAYLVLCALALVNFYYLYHPRILFGGFEAIRLPLKGLVCGEVLWLALFWILCGAWAFRLMAQKEKGEAILI